MEFVREIQTQFEWKGIFRRFSRANDDDDFLFFLAQNNENERIKIISMRCCCSCVFVFFGTWPLSELATRNFYSTLMWE